jgi:large subunit ribosomal protein L24
MKSVRKGDRVQVLSGEDRGKIGRVLSVVPEKDRILVENINMVTKHQRATQTLRQPGIVKREATFPASKVLPICPGCDTPSRVRFVDVDGKKTRKCSRCGETF